jgi:hypothetical protein
VRTDNIYLPTGTDGTDGQGFGGLPYALTMLTTSFANGLSTFTDGGFISPSVPMENIYLPMVNWLTIGTSEHSIFTDDIFISPSVRMDTDGRNNFTKLTVSMLATVLDNPRTFYSLIMCILQKKGLNGANNHYNQYWGGCRRI